MTSTRPRPRPRSRRPAGSGRELLVKGGAALGVVALATVLTSGTVLLTARSSEHELTAYAASVLAERDAVQAVQSDFYAYDDQLNMWVLVGATQASQAQLLADTRDQAVAAGKALQADLDRAAALAGADQRASVAKLRTGVAGYQEFAGQVDAAMTGPVGSPRTSSVSTAAGSTTQALGQTRTAVEELSRMAADLRTTVGRFTY